ncbi:MAG: hypothetical protein AAF928_17985 [Myxococcota bacterium]
MSRRSGLRGVDPVLVRRGGTLLMALGFLGGAFFMVQRPDAIPWAAFAGPTLVCAVGSGLMRGAQKRVGARAGKVRADITTLEDALTTLVTRVAAMNADIERPDADVFSFSGRIDRELMAPINAFVDAREAVIHRYGLPVYASMMDAFAGGERALNRGWCASVDGYVDEVKRCLDRAHHHLSRARGVLVEVAASDGQPPV